MSDDDNEVRIPLPPALLAALYGPPQETHVSLTSEEVERLLAGFAELPEPPGGDSAWRLDVDGHNRVVAYMREGQLEGVDLTYTVAIKVCGSMEKPHYHAGYAVNDDLVAYFDDDGVEMSFPTIADAARKVEDDLAERLRDIALQLVNKTGGTH